MKESRLGFFALGAATMSAWIVQGLVMGSEMDVGAVTVVLFGLLVSSWIASIYVWSRYGTSGFLHFLALAVLILLGFFLGWVYLLFAARDLPPRRQKQSS